MQVVIEIPYGTYDAIQQGLTNQVITNKLWESVKAGTPLPKGHGDLVDRDAINSSIYAELDSLSNKPTYRELLDKFSMCLDTAPTIIEGSDSE